jgi:hypothetical protein
MDHLFAIHAPYLNCESIQEIHPCSILLRVTAQLVFQTVDCGVLTKKQIATQYACCNQTYQSLSHLQSFISINEYVVFS